MRKSNTEDTGGQVTDIVLKAHSLVMTIAEPRAGEKRPVLITRVFRRIITSNPTFTRWSERRVRSHFDREFRDEPHRVRQLEVDDLERVAAPIKEKADAAIQHLLEMRERLVASGPSFHSEQIMAIDTALHAVGIVDLPRIQAED